MNVLLPDRSQLILNPKWVSSLLEKYPYLTENDLRFHIREAYNQIAIEKSDTSSVSNDVSLECFIILEESGIAVPIRTLERARRILTQRQANIAFYGKLYTFLQEAVQHHSKRAIAEFAKETFGAVDGEEDLRKMVSLLDKIPVFLETPPYIKGEDESVWKLYVWKLVYSFNGGDLEKSKILIRSRSAVAATVISNILKLKDTTTK